MLSAGILAAALFALLAFAPFASAASNPVGSGSTTITLNSNWKKYLRTFGIKIQKTGSAKLKGNKATFKVTEGSLDTNGIGTFNLAGGLKFKAGKKSANVAGLVINTAKKTLTAKVGGKRVKFATLAGISSTRNGFGNNITIKRLKLTGAAAKQLNKKTGYAKGKPKPFIGNKLIGKSKSEVQPATLGIQATGIASLQLAPSALEKLGKVGSPPFPPGESPVAVELSPVAPTTFDVPTLTAGFPIGSEGTIAPNGQAGTLKTVGGLKLVQNLEAVTLEPGNVTTLTMGNIWVDLGAKTASVEVIVENPAFEAGKGPNLGNLGRASIADISLTGATITSDPATHTVSVQNASATLQAVTAATLNQVFIEGLEEALGPQEKFAAGDPLGTFSFTAQTE